MDRIPGKDDEKRGAKAAVRHICSRLPWNQFVFRSVTGVAPSAWERFQERVVRLYEQDAAPEEIRQRIGQYVRRWKRWVSSGVREVSKAFEWPGGSRGPTASRRTLVPRPVSSSP